MNSEYTYPSREVIIGSQQIDKDLIELINSELLKLIDSLSHFIYVDMHSQKLENFSKFFYLFSCYYIRKDKTTSGEEYTNIKINFPDNISILFYIIVISIRNSIIKLVYNKFQIFIENKINYRKGLKFTLFHNIIERLYQDIPNLDDVFEKINEYKYCFFFINGKYLDFIQKIFRIKYTTIENSNIETIIDEKGFSLIGYAIAFKLVVEFLMKLKYLISIIKQENLKLSKKLNQNNNNELLSNDSYKRLNIKLKPNEVINNSNLDEAKCLLCLDTRRDTSTTICGHLFCWSCITKYLQNKSNCPYCRKECYPKNVLFLNNYK